MADAASTAHPIKLTSITASLRRDSLNHWLLVQAVLGALACREPASVAKTTDTVDSAGVQVVTSTGPAWGDRAAWKVAGSATLTLGGVAGDSALDFIGIVGAKRLSDGSLVVANGGTGELRWYSASGKHIRTVGGRRSGPTRFAALISLYSLGDTLFAWDGRARVLSRLSPSGEMLRQDRLRLTDSTRLFAVLGVFGDGSVLAEAGTALELKDREPGIVRPGRSLFRIGPAGADSVGILPGEELQLRTTGGRASLTAVPFGLGSRLSVLPDGFITSEGDRMQLHEHDMTGRLRRIIRWPGGRLPVSTDDVDRQGRALLGSARSGMQRAQLDSVWRGSTKPDSLPAVIGLMPDPQSLAWVRQGGHVADTEAVWWVFSRNGAWLGALTLPTASSPLDISDDWIVLRTVDENRIERVEVRRLRR